MHIKNTETSMKFKFDAVASTFACDGAVQPVQLKKRRAYETVADSEQINLTDLDAISDDVFHGTAALPTGKTIDKSNIIKGYRYGQSLIPFGVAEQSLIEYSKKGKQLQLIQFTKIDNILPQFLLSNCRYLLPDSKYPASVDALSALVHAMLELGVVALCRYSYNINSNPRMVCLMPKISKKSNVPVLIHYTMPFNEDLRNYEFPLLEKLGNEPTAYQLDVVDEFINSFDLSNSISGGELMRCKSILNPKHQYQCQLLRQKAMHSNEPLPEIQREKLLENVSPPKQFVKYAKHIIETMKESFPLEKNPYTRVAAFSTNITKKPAANQSLSTENKPENNELDSKSF